MAEPIKYALRTEMLERNPDLKKNWFTRVFAAVIVGGASIQPSRWPQVRLGICFAPVIILVFTYNLIHGHDMPTYKQVISIVLVTCFTAMLPLFAATAYGYWKRDAIDTSGSLKPDFSYLKRYMLFWAFIGVAVSTGFGFFHRSLANKSLSSKMGMCCTTVSRP